MVIGGGGQLIILEWNLSSHLFDLYDWDVVSESYQFKLTKKKNNIQRMQFFLILHDSEINKLLIKLIILIHFIFKTTNCKKSLKGCPKTRNQT